MDSTITAAWISGGVGALGIVSTAATAWIGSRSTRKATEQAITAGADNTRATLAAAREDRLWERRCTAYEDAVAGLLLRQRKRQQSAVLYRPDTPFEPDRLREYRASQQAPSWFESQARLTPYASDEVLAAYNASQEADSEAWWRYDQWLGAVETHQRVIVFEHPLDTATLEEIRNEAKAALEEAMARDRALIEVIRDELRRVPEAALQSPALPAVHRGLWQRRKTADD